MLREKFHRFEILIRALITVTHDAFDVKFVHLLLELQAEKDVVNTLSRLRIDGNQVKTALERAEGRSAGRNGDERRLPFPLARVQEEQEPQQREGRLRVEIVVVDPEPVVAERDSNRGLVRAGAA